MMSNDWPRRWLFPELVAFHMFIFGSLVGEALVSVLFIESLLFTSSVVARGPLVLNGRNPFEMVVWPLAAVEVVPRRSPLFHFSEGRLTIIVSLASRLIGPVNSWSSFSQMFSLRSIDCVLRLGKNLESLDDRSSSSLRDSDDTGSLRSSGTCNNVDLAICLPAIAN